MNWRNLGNAILVVSMLCGFTALFIYLAHHFPVLLSVITFAGLVLVIYNALDNSGKSEDDIDRMSWFSGNEDEDEDEDKEEEE